jgi:hypothetical protein
LGKKYEEGEEKKGEYGKKNEKREQKGEKSK